MQSDVRKALSDMNSRKSTYSIFKKKLAALDADTKGSLIGNPDETLKKLEDEVLAPLKLLDASMA